MLEETNDFRGRPSQPQWRGYAQLALIGLLIALALLMARAPRRTESGAVSGVGPEAEARRPTVKVMQPAATDHALTLELTGTVSLEEKASVAAEVAGRVTWVAPGFSNGGSFAADEPLIRIDPRKFELRVEAAELAVAEAEAKVWAQKARGEEEARKFAAENPGVEPSDWIRRLPKIAEAEAGLARARAELRLAELRLEDTVISFPYDGRVLISDVEVGELVGPVDLVGRTQLGVVYRRESIQVEVPIEPLDLDRLSPAIGRSARVSGDLGDWTARVVRVSSAIGPKTQMASVFLRFSGNVGASSLPVPGTFVEVAIEGPTHRGVFVLPESAMQELDRLWVVKGGALRSVETEAVGRTPDGWVVRAFDSGSGVVVGTLPRASDGLEVAVAD